jgi:diguanylate cyclase (GGDEF)-like protein
MEPSAVTELSYQLRRERLLDMEGRLARVRVRAFVVLGLSLLASGPWVGYWFLLPLAGAGLAFAAADRRVRRSRHPERWAAIGWGVAPLAIAVSVALTGAADGPALCWFALPVVTLGARFEPGGVRAGVGYTVALVLIVTLGMDHATVIDDPTRVLAVLALVIAIGILTGAAAESEREHRRGAVMDPLTGLLNRSALAQRLAELEQQAAQDIGASLGLLIADIDHFKAVNDEHGHLAGDAVLRDTAYAMRKTLRAFDLIYRVGGEEFVVLLPGADLEKTVEIGERLREAVAATDSSGIRVTLSLGAAAGCGDRAAYRDLFAAADGALYRAKRSGRDRIEVAGAALEGAPAG